MNLYEDTKNKKSSELSKQKEDLIRTYKSKTPVPNIQNKQKLKKNPKRVIQKSNTPKKECQRLYKHNSNDYKEGLSEIIIKRTKNKGSKSVESFNNIQETKKCPAAKNPLNNSNLNKCKVYRKHEKGDLKPKFHKGLKNTDKLRKKSPNPGDLKAKDQKPQRNYLNIQKLLNNYASKKKVGKSKSNKKHLLEDPIKTNESVSNSSKISNYKSKNLLNLEYDPEDSEDLAQQNIKIDSWLAKNHSKMTDSLENFSEINEDNIVEESEVIEKNFSFINTENLKNSRRPEIFEKNLNKSFEFNNEQVDFIVYEADLEVHNMSRSQNPEISNEKFMVQKQDFININPKKPEFSLFSTNFKGISKKSPKLTLDCQVQVNIPSQNAGKPANLQKFQIYSKKTEHLCQTSQTWNCSICPKNSSNTQIFIEQISEELSNNINSLFIIEQLRNLEILANTVNVAKISEESQTKMKEYIENKYFVIINFLQPGIEYRISQFLSILSQAETSDFLLKSQKKKEIIKELLSDIPPPQIILPELSKPSENSSNSSNSSDEELEALNLPKYSQNSNMYTFPTKSTESTENSIPLLSISLKPIECEPESQSSLNNHTLLSYAKNVLQSLNPYSLIAILENPLKRDPLKELDKIQDLQIGTFTDLEIRNYEKLIDYEKALKIELSNFDEYKDQQTVKVEKSVKVMVLDCLNYLLQQFRPFGYKGEPLIWQRLKQFDGKIESFEEIYEKALKDFKELASNAIGKWDEGFGENDENNVRARITEMQINRVLNQEFGGEDSKWIDYEFEEVQVKIDLADVVLYELVTEVIDINN